MLRDNATWITIFLFMITWALIMMWALVILGKLKDSGT